MIGNTIPSFETVASVENLYCAYKKACKGKTGRDDVGEFRMKWETHLTKLSDSLLSGEYQPGRYTMFIVHEKKTRKIMATPFIDRIVHHAICNVMTPVLERSMVPNTCANRVGRGTGEGLRLYARFAKRYRYVLKCDIRHFFPSIDRKILLDSLKRKIQDARLLELVRTVLFVAPAISDNAPYFPGDTLFTPHERERGLPIGNMTSQTWANWYLDPLDHFIMDFKGFGAYMRYVDDFAVFADDKVALACLKNEIQEFLCRLRLIIHPDKSRVYRTADGVPFLGFRHWSTHRVLCKPGLRRFKRRVRQKARIAAASGDMRALWSSIAGWSGFARLGDTYRLRMRLREEIRGILDKGQGGALTGVARRLVEQQREQPPRCEPGQQQPRQLREHKGIMKRLWEQTLLIIGMYIFSIFTTTLYFIL